MKFCHKTVKSSGIILRNSFRQRREVYQCPCTRSLGFSVDRRRQRRRHLGWLRILQSSMGCWHRRGLITFLSRAKLYQRHCRWPESCPLLGTWHHTAFEILWSLCWCRVPNFQTRWMGMQWFSIPAFRTTWLVQLDPCSSSQWVLTLKPRWQRELPSYLQVTSTCWFFYHQLWLQIGQRSSLLQIYL